MEFVKENFNFPEPITKIRFIDKSKNIIEVNGTDKNQNKHE